MKRIKWIVKSLILIAVLIIGYVLYVEAQVDKSPPAPTRTVTHIARPGDSDFIGPIQQTRGSIGRSGPGATGN